MFQDFREKKGARTDMGHYTICYSYEHYWKLFHDEGSVDQIYLFPKHIWNYNIVEVFCDGTLYKNHPIFSAALQIWFIAYYVEMQSFRYTCKMP